MYNTDESRVIDNFNLDCNNNTKIKQKDRCPSRYISTDTYKYQVCYNKRKSQESIDKQHLNIRHADNSCVSSTIFIILFAATLIIAISLAVLLILVRSGRIWKNRHLSRKQLEANIKGTETEAQGRAQAEENTVHDQFEDPESDAHPLLHRNKNKESSNIRMSPRKETNIQSNHKMGRAVPKNDNTSKSTTVERNTNDGVVSERKKEVKLVAESQIVKKRKRKIENKSSEDGDEESQTDVSAENELTKEDAEDKDKLETIEEDDNKTNDSTTHLPDFPNEDDTHATSRKEQDNQVGHVQKNDTLTPATLNQSNNDEKADTVTNTETKAEQSNKQLEADTTDKPDEQSAPMRIQGEKNVPLNVDKTCDKETPGSEKIMSKEESQQQGEGIVSKNVELFDPKKKEGASKC